MAEVVISAILPVIFEKLTSSLIKNLFFRNDVQKDLDRLCTTLTLIQAVIKDAEEQQKERNYIKNWLINLEEVAYDIIHILDECATENLRGEVEIRGRILNKVCNCFTLSNPRAFTYMMGLKIRGVVDRLDLIEQQRSAFNLSERIVGKQSHSVDERETHSFVHEAEVSGRKGDREKLVELLINMGSEKEGTKDLSIVPIVGMGGIGKTTLAKYIYNDERVKNHFDQRIWAYVSKDFDLGKIIRTIISLATDGSCDLASLEELQSRLRKILDGKKYLIVLDDVWNEAKKKWDELKNLLSCGGRGIRVIVTTRSLTVASVVGTLPAHCLEGLHEDDGWSLFKKSASFPQGGEHEFPDLVTIGKEIVKRCEGVPLAVKALGGLLLNKRSKKEWLEVKESKIWELDDKEIISTLRLSYDHLSSGLKKCFLFCSIFPRGCAFERFFVIQLWIAEEFIQASNTSRLAEDIGVEYFDMLCSSSLFQKVDDDGILFRMHDLVWDLARSIAGTEYSIIESSSVTDVSAKTRHLSYFHKEDLPSMNSSFVSNSKKLCTFILTGCTKKLPGDILNLTRLRVLNLSFTNVKNLPESIKKLKQLRYLDMSDTPIRKLPKSIVTLLNMQTLRLLNCFFLKKLPKGMKRMVNLRHLEIDNVEEIERVPSGLGQLKCLQTLPLFIVGKEEGRRIGELEGLNLRGRLMIKSLQNVLNPADAERAGLKKKQNISDLHLSWEDINDDSINGGNENYQHVVESLEPHPNIEKLVIENFKGLKFPTWLKDLSNLIVIHLKNCSRCASLPSFSQLRCLKVLAIEHMPELACLPEELGNLSSLEALILIDCPRILQFPTGLKNATNLQLIYIKDCPNLIKRCTRETAGEDWDKIAHVPFILIDHGCKNKDDSLIDLIL